MQRAVAVAVLAVLLGGRAVAADRTWIGAVDTNWSNPLNWNPAGTPAADDSLTFPATPLESTITFDMPAGSAVGSLHILGDYAFSGNGMTINGTVDVNGRIVSFASIGSTFLNGPLTGSGTINAGAPGVAFVGGGTFSGNIEGYAFIGGVYPNSTFHGPWITGTGTAAAISAGLLSPGVWASDSNGDPHSVGWMNCGPLSITSQLSIDIQPEGNREQVIANGPVSIAGKLAVTMVGTYPAIDGMEFPIIDNRGGGAVSGTFEGLPEGATLTSGKYTFWITYKGGDGNDVVLTAGLPAKTWTGANSDAWSDPANWQPAGVPAAGEPLLFPPCCSSRPVTTNDLPAGFNPGPITFNGTYTLGGNLLTLTHDLEFANSGFTASLTCNAPLKLGGSVHINHGLTTIFSAPIDMNGNTLTVGSNEARFRGPIDGAGAIVVTGPGIWLESSGSFRGQISGFVHIAGEYPNATVSGGGASGTGTLSAVTAGTVSPGAWFSTTDDEGTVPPHETATLHTASLSISTKYIADIDPASGSSDRIQVAGNVSLGGTLQLFFMSPPAAGQSWTLIDNDGSDPVNGTFSGLPEGTIFSAGGYGTSPNLRITYEGGDGNDVVVTRLGTNAASTATALAQDHEATEWHQPVTFTATVTSANGIPSGVISFMDGATALGSSPLQTGVATLTTSALAPGDHTITASYEGSNSFAASSSAPLVHRVVKRDPHVTLAPSKLQPAYGDGLAITVHVDGDADGAGTPGGNVSLAIDHSPAGTAALVGGDATIQLPLIAAGPHTVDASYFGDAAFNTASASTSLSVAKAATALTIESAANPAPAGVGITLHFRVSATAHPALPVDGTILVNRSGILVAQASIAGDAATVRLAPSAADEEITAGYSGGANFEDATASLLQHVTIPALSITDTTFASSSGGSDETVQVELSAASPLPVSVDYRTVDGTAKAGVDYLASQGTLIFAPGNTAATIAIHVPPAAPQPPKSFAIELANVSGASLGSARATVTIVSDDPLPFRTPVDYAYENIDGIPLRLTFYAPASGSGPWPVILWIPGDAAYDAEANGIPALHETARGYAVVSVAYRPAAMTAFPAQIDDLEAAVRWLGANAPTLGIDPGRIVAWGSGAGGHLAALLGTRIDVKAVIDWRGIADIPTLQADALGCSTVDWNAPASPVSLLIGCPVAQCSDAAGAASPALYATKKNPPFLLMHGGADCFVSPMQSAHLYGALTTAGVDVTLRVIDGVAHDDSFWASPAAFTEVEGFLDRVLQPPARRRPVRH